MQTTEKKYWHNGFERRGTFWSIGLSAWRVGLLICRPGHNNPVFNFYWLT